MKNLENILYDYLAAIEAAGSLIPKALGPAPDAGWIDAMNALEQITVPDDLKTYFTKINGWDADSDLDLFEPELAWGMFPLSTDRSIEDYVEIADIVGDENPDYWPLGFVPILADGAGSWVLVNCIAASPTYGAVYEMTHCVGINRIAGSLADYFAGLTQVVKAGWKVFDGDSSDITVDGDEYADLQAGVFGHTPYFTTRGSDQVVDWR
ncbi:SMI1/KNR4 family protein [Pseudoduganella albidiflava]|nr:SMI1/KNR4 family protein [Pseudoduganella albidiflava]QBI01974.1 hypothetical protein EYF70_14770 [Pseudoduganella albidiflava]